MFTNDSGYITDGNTNWNNTYGFITASSTDTLTNKSGNISQWTNDSGYITGYTETDTLATVTARGNTTSASISVNQVIATNNGSGTNYRVGDDAWIGDINIANTLRVSGVQNSNNGYITFGNSSNTQLGRAGTGDLTWGGVFAVSTSIKSPIFYDSSNTAYYAYPSSQSVFYRLKLQGTGTAHAATLEIDNPSTSQFIHTGELFTANQTAGQANIFVIGKSGSTKNSGYIGYNWASNSSNNNYISIGQWGADHLFRVYGDQVLSTVTLRSDVDMRAPIFYDKDNTTYYVNPATSSLLKAVQIDTTSNTVGSALKIYTTTAHQYPQIYSNGTLEAMWNYKNSAAEWYVGVRTSTQLLGNTGFHFYNTSQGQTVGGWDINGHSYSISSSRAPIFYDSNNTGYYTDPNSTGTSLKIAGGIQANTPNGNVIIKHTVSEANSWIFQENATNWGLFWMNEPITGTAFGSYTTVGAEFIGFRQGTATNFVNPSSYTGINTSAYAGWLLSNYSGYFWTAGTQYSAADMRAPIFYDSNDTTYYVNAATGSNLHTPITFQTNDSTLTFQDAGTNAFQMKMSAGDELYLGSNNNYQLQMTTSGNVNTQGQWRFGANFVKVGNSSTYNSDDGGWGSRFVVASTVHARIDCAQDANAVRASWYTHTGQLYSTFGTVTGHDMRLISHNAIRQYLYNGWSQEASSYRAPIFYDSNDTTYYLDPNTTGTSLNAAGKILGSNINTDIKYLGTGVSYDVNSRTTKVTDGIAIYGAYSGGSNSPHTYDMSMQVVGSSRGFELSAAWWTQPALYIRTLRDCCTDWSSWYGIALHGLNPGTSAGALYAPEFYDSNDTGYYINPNSSSKLSGLKLEPASGTNQASGDDNVLWIHRTNNNDWGIQINADQGGATDYGYEFLGGSSHTYAFSGVAAGTRYFNVGSSYAQHDGSFRAPIFYDSNNTAYKADFADTGNSIVAAGSYNAQNYNKPALLLNASGTGSSGAAFGMQQVTAEGWTGVFVDYEPYTGWGLYHDNPNNYFCVTAESSTGNIRSFTVPSRSSGNRTSYEKIRFDQNNGNIISGGSITSNGGYLYLSSGNSIFSPSGGVIKTASTFYAARFYDYDNSTRYVDVSSTSYIATLHTSGTIQAGNSGTGNIYLGNTGVSGSGNHFRFHTNNSHTYFDGNCGDIHWRQGNSTRLYFYMTTATMTINGTLTQYSDERLKQNVVTIDNALNKVNQLRGVYYNRTDINTEANQIGLIAQETESVVPEVVHTANDELGTKSISYGQLNALLVEAIKEQQTIIDNLKSRIETLENQ